MASLRVEFTIAETVDLIEGLEDRLTDLTPAMNAVGEYMLAKTRDRFDDEVDPDGRRWQVLAPRTVESKQRRKTKPGKRARVRAGASNILKESFLLRDTIAYQADSTSVRVGTPQEYGVFHQSDEPRSKIPQRKFLGVDAEDLAEINEIVSDYLRL
jgi:phage virion morphogenesis protein